MKHSVHEVIARKGFCLFDGGLATEIERYRKIESSLWSCSLLLDSEGHEITRKVHEAYLESGADILITNSYQLSRLSLQKYAVEIGDTDISPTMIDERVCKLLSACIELGSKAIANSAAENKLLAVSFGSYGASLADGSEYTGTYADSMTSEEFAQFYRPRLDHLNSSCKFDLVVFETIPSFKEIQSIISLMSTEFKSIPYMISFTVKSPTEFSTGENIESCLKEVDFKTEKDNFIGFGANCSNPKTSLQAMALVTPVLATHTVPLCYANKGESWNHDTHEWTSTECSTDADFASIAADLHSAGVLLIGGCCRTSPDTIRLIDAQLQKKAAVNVPQVQK